MSEENTFRPVYLKESNFSESGYEQQLKQSSLTDLAVRSNYNALNLKENKGSIGNINFLYELYLEHLLVHKVKCLMQ